MNLKYCSSGGMYYTNSHLCNYVKYRNLLPAGYKGKNLSNLVFVWWNDFREIINEPSGIKTKRNRIKDGSEI